jgi:hypothetical protein
LTGQDHEVAARLSEIVRVERRTRLYDNLSRACLYSFIAAIAVIILLSGVLPARASWLSPIFFMVIAAPLLLLRHRWRDQDAKRVVARADRILRLDERALTAWELLQRGDATGAALLVYQQAHKKLAGTDARSIVPRHWSWPAHLLIPAAAVWAGLAWFQPRMDWHRHQSTGTPAHEVQRFARDLQEKARNEKLPETLRLAQELEKNAQKALQASAGRERLQEMVSAMAKRFRDAAKAAGGKSSASAGESDEALEDLKAQIEAARDMFNAAEGTRQFDQSLAALPQLERRLKPGASTGGLSRADLDSMLDRLDKEVSGELDRRALLDAEEFLQRMMQRGEPENMQAGNQVGGTGQPKLGGNGEERANSNSSAPGDRPGEKTNGTGTLPEFGPGAETRVKGMLRGGESSGTLLKGSSGTAESHVAQQELIASYRRQAEADLTSENVPDALKETVRNYFLSLREQTEGSGEQKSDNRNLKPGSPE